MRLGRSGGKTGGRGCGEVEFVIVGRSGDYGGSAGSRLLGNTDGIGECC